MNKIFKRSFCLLFLCITFLCSGCSLLENNTEYQKEKKDVSLIKMIFHDLVMAEMSMLYLTILMKVPILANGSDIFGN